jgi:hypothetical protein
MTDEIFESSTKKPAIKESKAPTVLDQLKEALSKKVEREPVFIEVPERPGVTIQVSPNITQHQLRSWRKNAGEDTKNGLDATKFACAVIGHTCIGIFINGEQVVNDDGIGLTFASDAILDMTGTTRPIPDCVRAFFGIDPHVESAALAVLEAAGYSDTVETVDPTKNS